MNKIFILFLVFPYLLFVNAQTIKKPVITETKKDVVKPKTEKKSQQKTKPAKKEDWRKKYDEVGFFYGTREEAKVKSNGKIGFVNKNGQVIIPIIYDDAGVSFNEGLVTVALDGKYGFINKQNETIVPLIYESAGHFLNGLAIIKKDGKYGLIDKKGQTKTSIKYSWIESNSGVYIYGNEGYRVKIENKWGYLDKNGKERTRVEYDGLVWYNESSGLAEVLKGVEEILVDINTQKELNLSGEITRFDNYCGGFLGVKLEKYKYGFRNRDGKLQPYTYRYIGDFRDGIYRVQANNGGIFYINCDHKCIKDCQNAPADHPKL